jgi:hypothetical protein
LEAYSAESGCPLPLRANVTTASAIATPIAEPYAAIPASAIGHLDRDIEYNDDDWFFLFFTKYHNFKKLCKYTLVKIKIKKKNSFFCFVVLLSWVRVSFASKSKCDYCECNCYSNC